MKKNCFIVVGLALLLAALTGCGNKNADNKEKRADDIISRAEFIEMLGDEFGYDNYVSKDPLIPDVPKTNPYFNYIQACAEWNIIEAGTNLVPEESVTIKFATESAVRAVGIDILELSGVLIDKDNLTDFYINNIAALDTDDLSQNITRATAESIIEYADTYRHTIVLPQHISAEYREGVKESAGNVILNSDGVSGFFGDASKYSVGDVIYWDMEKDGFTYAAKVTSIDGNAFTCERVSPEDVYANVSLSGTFDGKVVGVHTASENVTAGPELYEKMRSYGGMNSDGISYSVEPLANSVTALEGNNIIGYRVVFDGDMQSKDGDSDFSPTTKTKAHGEFVMKITNTSIQLVYEHEWFRPLSPTKIAYRANLDTEISSQISGSIATSIPLGYADIHVWGLFFIRLELIANVGASGDISLSYTTANSFEAGWQKKQGMYKEFDTKSSLNLVADVSLVSECTLLADLRHGFTFDGFSDSILNAQITTGGVAAVRTEADLLSSDPVCTDVLLYIPLRVGVNQAGCVLTRINKDFQWKYTIWDSDNSPFKWHFHFEDAVRTPKDLCTRGKGKEVEQPDTDEDGKPLDEYKIFDFEPLEFDFIILESYKTILMPGDIAEIKFSEIPEGYDKSSLTYEVQDTSICSVENGVVTGKAPGSTIVKISTADGLFSAYLAVTVNDDYSSTGFDGL